jgi:signal transduction histidine kinase
MRLIRGASVKTKLILASVLGSGTALLVVGAVITSQHLGGLRSALVRRMSVQAEIVGTNCISALLFNDAHSAEVTLMALKADPHVTSAGLYGTDHQLFALYQRDAALPTGLPAESDDETGNDYTLHEDRLILARNVFFEQRTIGKVVIESDLGEISASMKGDLGVVASVLLVSLIIALVISSRLQRDITQPIGHLAETARAVSQDKDYSVRVSGERGDEIGALMSAFNGMLEEIEKQAAALQMAHDKLEERVTERTAQLNAANEELEAFSYSVSHDLRAPLRHITGFSDMLHEHAKSELDDTGRRYLDVIAKAAERMGTLIDDLLGFSRMGRAAMTRLTVQLGPMVKDVIRELSEGTAGRRIEWVVGELPDVQGDAAMLRLVLVNLIGNAVKYTRGRDEARIEIGAKEGEDGETVVFVRDNGAGFDAQYAHKLFGVFQRLHSSDEFEGTGIGLANVKRIVHRHDGRAWADGNIDRGATFYFSLPRQEEAVRCSS